MDLHDFISRVPGDANLRSRGDGPSCSGITRLPCHKPPLTRRWTRYLSHGISKMPQTSAHAEMDLAPATQTKIFKPNLRSRGDGPKPRLRGHFLFCKPPLTRRWTPDLLRRQRRRRQTSAHAEMDQQTRPFHHLHGTNLRSRGDGPDHEKDDADSVSKPPLTRRWTCLACLRGPAVRQTSAHAGMNLKCTTLTVGEYAKPRSRGDEPSVVVQYSADDGKTPLTRRWTYSMMLLMPKNHQTSAHAEMDPTRRWPEPSRQANLRSRGDGPPKNQSGSLVASKPPLTRRWTGKG